jgi:ribosomal protein S6--L-glutamate ligase
MTGTSYFVSFHRRIPLDENLSLFEDLSDYWVRHVIANAVGVLLPTYVTPQRYFQITSLACSWFPRLDVRFRCLGKTRQIELFRRFGVRHPESMLFANPRELVVRCADHGCPWGFPLVIKGDLGGGGVGVFPVYAAADIGRQAARLPADQPALLQRWVDHQGKDLRVVVYGDLAVSYFRVGDGGFYNNVCRGGRIDHDLWPDRQRQGVEAVLAMCRRVGIDIAGFDLMFPDHSDPVFVEINHHFGHKGLGGTAGHQNNFLQAVERWRQRLLCSHPKRCGGPDRFLLRKLQSHAILPQQGP